MMEKSSRIEGLSSLMLQLMSFGVGIPTELWQPYFVGPVIMTSLLSVHPPPPPHNTVSPKSKRGSIRVLYKVGTNSSNIFVWVKTVKKHASLKHPKVVSNH